MMMKKKYLFIAMTLLTPFAYSQQKSDSLAVIQVREIVVTANRMPIPLKSTSSSVSLVNKNFLKSMPRCIAANEAVRLVPGLRIDNQANGSRIHLSIRGQGILSERGIRGIRVLLDGIPVNDPSGFAPDLYDIDWAIVDRIEVVRGISPSLYGGSSPAGVVNVITQNGSQEPFSPRIFSSVGSNGFKKLTAQASGRSGSDVDFRVSLSRMQGDGFRQHTAFKSTILNEKINWTPRPDLKLTQLLIATGYFNQNAEGLNQEQVGENPQQANPDAIPLNEYQKTRRITNGLVGDYQVTDQQTLFFTLYHHNTHYKEPGSRAVQYRDFQTPGGSIQYLVNIPFGKIQNHFSMGAEMQWQTIQEYKTANIKVENRIEKIGVISEDVKEDTILLAHQTIDQRGVGVFVIDRIDVGDKMNFILNIRYDDMHHQLTDHRNIATNLSGRAQFYKTTVSLGGIYSLSNAVNLYTNWGQGFLPPATEELASNPASFGGFNKKLVPASSIGKEIGIRGEVQKKLFYDFVFFSLNTQNDFYRYRILPQRPLETFYGNAGASKRYGLESFLSWRLFHSMIVNASYTYSNFKYTSPDSIKNNRLPNSPEHQLFAELEYRLPHNVTIGLSTELQTEWAIYTDRSHRDITQDGFQLYHTRISYHWQFAGLQGDFSVHGVNLTNKLYIAFTEPDPDGNCYQPAARREFFANLMIQL